MSLRTVVAALAAWLAFGPALAGEAPVETPPPAAEEGAAEGVERAGGAEAEAPKENAAPEEPPPGGETEPDGAEAGEGARPRPPGVDMVEKLRERAGKAPPVPGEERLERAAATASRLIRPLPQPFAVGATIVGFILMLFGQRLFRTGIVLYFMALLGMIGREMGQQYDSFAGPLIGGCAGCVVGAAVALPLRALVRALVGGLTGGVLASILVQSLTSDLAVTLVVVAAGIAVSGVLTFFFPKPLLVIGFALFGAVTASIGVLSMATDPVATQSGPRLDYGAAHVAGVVFAAALGVLFQSHLEEKEPDDE